MATPVDPRSSYAALDGLRLHYLEWGAPDAPALVLLHALGVLVTAHDWDGLAAAVQGTHRVIALDQRGFGLSDWTPAYSFELMAQDLAQLAEHLHLDGFTLIGHSMGGYVAALYAEACPDRLGRLVLEDTVPPREGRRYERTADLQWEYAGFDEFARQQGVQAGDDELRERYLHATRTVEGGRQAFRLDPAVPQAILAQLADPEPTWWHDLDRIGVPTLLVRGADSTVLDAEQATLAAAAITNCRVVVVPHAGHSVHYDNPTGFLEAISAFLG